MTETRSDIVSPDTLIIVSPFSRNPTRHSAFPTPYSSHKRPIPSSIFLTPTQNPRINPPPDLTMSTPHLSPPTQRMPQPEPKSKETPPSNPPPPNEATHYTCTCGDPDSSENWICCDNLNCPITWYHWECARITAAPSPGEWFCPTCRPSATTTTITPKKVPAKTPRSGKKKGIAVKKATPKKKGRSKWFGWASEDEDEQEHKGGNKVDKTAEAAAVRAKTQEMMVRATKSGGRARKSQTPLEGRKSKPVEASREHGNPEKRPLSRGGLEEDGTEPVANVKKDKPRWALSRHPLSSPHDLHR